ncbi:MAG TPA: DUF4097 family beta strand repeat-containing protein [Vicinamibacterales bacterium]|nr:DUF4097 family beta strand repeat-containing protein [Vicinamibacterales bacterium]
MKTMTDRLRAVAWLLPILVVASAGCDIAMADFREQEVAEWRKTYELQPGGRVEIANVNGKIEVMPGPGSSVEIFAKKIGKAASKEAAKQALERIQIVESNTGGVIKVETRLERSNGGMFGHSNRQVEYVVRVPANAELKLSTVNGGVEIAGMTGRIHAEATNGGIRGRDIAGTIDASTTNGGVEVELSSVPAGGVKLECTNGGIRLRLPSDSKASISARVSNGGIDTEGLSLQTRGEYSGRRVEGDLNGGGPRIDLEGTNGGIKISAR